MGRRPSTCVRLVFTGLFVLALCSNAPRLASADEAAHIGMATRAGVPGTLSADLLRVLRAHYDVTGLGTAAGSRPTPRLQARAARAEVSVILVVSKRGRMLTLAYHDAETGKRLGVARFYVRGTTLAAQTAKKLLAATERYAPRTAEGGSDAFERGVASSRSRNAPASDADESEEAKPGIGEDSAEAPTRVQADEVEEDAAEPDVEQAVVDAEESTTLPAEEDRVELTVVGSVGTNMQSASMQLEGTRSQLDAPPAFALGVGARLAIGSREALHLWIEGRYMTSLEREVDELHMGGAPQPMSLRTHRLEGGLGPRAPLGRGVWLTPTLGYALRSVAPEVHFQRIPFYTLGGPYLRVELSAELFGHGSGLRLSPELQWLPQASTRVGGSRLDASRFAVGGQLTAFFRISQALDLELFLHESHAFANSSDVEVSDMERFVLANIAWRP